MHFVTLTLAALLSVAQAVDVHVVAVGKNPNKNETAIKFFPEKIEAKPGSMVQFQFWAGNHTVTQSTFDYPCVPISRVNSSITGISSSFQPVAASQDTGMIPVFTIMVNDTKPLWLYCAQGPHCQKGMVMVINENTSANSTRSLVNHKKLAEIAQVGDSNGTRAIGTTTPAPAKQSTPAKAGGTYLTVPTTMLVALGAGFMFL